MAKYLTVFAISWQNEFVYRLNFILWRLRNILRFLMTYFLWLGVFTVQTQVFGYSQPQILTYVFMVLIVQTLVMSAPSQDSIGGEIANGDLSNYLLKPINYIKYWFTRDLSSKLLNIIFAFFEVSLLWLIFRPEIRFPYQTDLVLGFLFSLSLAVLTYYFLSVLARLVAFWTPESTWGLSFVLLVFIEILAGGIFPLDILPPYVFNLLQLTPFPYLVYFPIAIFVGKVTGLELLRILIQSSIWMLVVYLVMNIIWQKGLKVYGAEGR